MKNKYLYLFLAAIFAASCTKPEDILDDFQVHVTPEFYSYIIQMEVEDIADPNAPLPSDLTVEITGPGSAGVYYSDGTKNFEVTNGILQMFIAREFEPVEGGSIDFNISLRAANYKLNTRNFSIGYEQYSTEVSAKLLNLNNLPSGVSNSTGTAAVDPATNALSAPLVIAASSADSSSSADITIPAGTKFLDADGNVIVGKGGASSLNVSVLSVSDTSESGQDSYPGGTGLFQKVETNGTTEYTLLDPSPSFEVAMDLGGVPVAGLDGGKMNGTFETRVNIPATQVNPVTSQAYAAGEEVTVLFFDYDADFWKQAPGSSTIQVDPADNKLFVTLNVPNPGPIKVYPRQSNISYSTFSIKGFIIPTDPVATPSKWGLIDVKDSRGVVYWCDGPYPTDPAGFNSATWASVFKAPTQRINDLAGARISWKYSLSGWDVNWKQRVTNVPAGVDFAYDCEIVQRNPGVTVGFTLDCGGAFINPPAGTTLKYREHDGNCQSTAPYQTLFTFNSQNVNQASNTFTEIEDGKFYDFKAIAAGQSVDTCNVEVIANNIYNVVPPASVCNAIGL